MAKKIFRTILFVGAFCALGSLNQSFGTDSGFYSEFGRKDLVRAVVRLDPTEREIRLKYFYQTYATEERERLKSVSKTWLDKANDPTLSRVCGGESTRKRYLESSKHCMEWSENLMKTDAVTVNTYLSGVSGCEAMIRDILEGNERKRGLNDIMIEALSKPIKELDRSGGLKF
jgi:hypothetical protein